jgi:hypothetical protein
MKAARFDSDQIMRCCTRKLRIEFRQGPECNGWFLLDGLKACRITVPHGRKPVPPGTFGSMARQLHLAPAEFALLLDCTTSLPEYAALLRQRRGGV